MLHGNDMLHDMLHGNATCEQIFERLDLNNPSVTSSELAVKRFARTVRIQCRACVGLLDAVNSRTTRVLTVADVPVD